MHRAQSPATTQAPERPQSPVQTASGLIFTRRDLFTLLGSAAVLAACGGKSHTASPITASGGAQASAATAPGSTNNSTPPLTGGASNSASGNVVQLGGPHATGNDAISVAEAQREAQTAGGHWQGGWHDATGASGDSDPHHCDRWCKPHRQGHRVVRRQVVRCGDSRDRTDEQPQDWLNRYSQKASSAS